MTNGQIWRYNFGNMRATTFVSCVYGELRGYRRWRIRREAAANARLDPDRLERLEAGLFEQRVRDALARFPMYADKVRAHRGPLPGPGEKIVARDLPIWTRRDQRALFERQPRPRDSAYIHRTSGSTGLPVTFHVTRESYEWRCAVADRGYSWAGAEEGSKTFVLWAGEQEAAPVAVRVKRSVHRRLQRRVFYDVFQRMGERELGECCRMINHFRPQAIVGYSSMLVELARFARDHPEALQWRARTLVMGVGMECHRHRGYHVHTDNVVVEVVGPDGEPVRPGEHGRLLITDLRNLATPFIRYEIGDYGAMAPAGPAGTCECGLPFPMLTDVDGRFMYVVYAADGRKLTGLFVPYIMSQFAWIEGYQVVQNEPGCIDVRLLSREELTPERTAPVAELLASKLGADMRIQFERVERLQRRAGGKVPLVISAITEE
jgi:phenylacetate-CoA ligase